NGPNFIANAYYNSGWKDVVDGPATGIAWNNPNGDLGVYIAASGTPVAANLLEQNFVADRPDQVWLADITYISTSEGWLYLAVILDLFTRKVVGWAMRARLRLARFPVAKPRCWRQQIPLAQKREDGRGTDSSQTLRWRGQSGA